MEQALIWKTDGWRWTLATTPDDAALFIPSAAIPDNLGDNCRIGVLMGSDSIILDMNGTNIRLQPAQPAVAARLLRMGSIVIAEQGGERCWVANISRPGDSAKVQRA